MDDNDRLDDTFSELLGAPGVPIADEDATYRLVVARAQRRIARRRLAATVLTMTVVGTAAITVAATTRHSTAVRVQASAASTTTAPSPNPTTTEPRTPPCATTGAGARFIVVTADGKTVGFLDNGDLFFHPAATLPVYSCDAKTVIGYTPAQVIVEAAPHGEVRIVWTDSSGHQHSATARLPATAP